MLEAIQTLEGHTDRVWTLAWSPDGSLLASSGADKTIRLWAKEDKWNCVSILTGSHNKSIRAISWSPCGTYLASASFDSTVCLWKKSSFGDWSSVVNLEGHESEVKCVAWSADGAYLASCGRDRTIWIWERATEETDDLDSAENWDCSDVKSDHTKDVKRIVWHPQYPILVSCSYDDTVKFFHKEDGDWICFQTLSAHKSTVWSADFSASGQYLVTCSDDKTVRVWKNHAHDKLPKVEEHSWKCISVIQGYHSRSIYDVSWSKLDNLIASASGDNSIAIYSMDSNEDAFICNEKLSQSHECDVNCVDWNPKHSGLFASGSDDRTIKLWKYTNEGMRSSTITDELLQTLSRMTTETNRTDNLSPTRLNVKNFSDLNGCVSAMQSLKEANFFDAEKRHIEKILDLKISSLNDCVIDISDLVFDECDGCVQEFRVNITDDSDQALFRFQLSIDKPSFMLKFPRRSVKIMNVKEDLFLVEKTGDLYQILPSGECKFLLGHLFMLSDVQFITRKDDGQILYILSADRDEKIRITNWPDTFEIERFCFGHKQLVRRLIAVNESKFISVDHQDEICVWNLDKLKDETYRPLYPEKVLSLDESSKKRLCIRVD
jgi:WD40 repeat protein